MPHPASSPLSGTQAKWLLALLGSPSLLIKLAVPVPAITTRGVPGSLCHKASIITDTLRPHSFRRVWRVASPPCLVMQLYLGAVQRSTSSLKGTLQGAHLCHTRITLQARHSRGASNLSALTLPSRFINTVFFGQQTTSPGTSTESCISPQQTLPAHWYPQTT